MFGGVGTAAAIVAIEQTLRQPVIYAAAQFVSFARPPGVLDIEVTVDASGRKTSQVSAVGAVAGVRVFVVRAAVGSRPGADAYQWAEPPDMPPPDACAPVALWPDQTDSLSSCIEFRMATGRFGQGSRTGKPSLDGRMVAWMRPANGGLIQSSDLAIFADYLPSAVGIALGRERTGANSLDNSLRLHGHATTEWALCSARLSGVTGEIAHGDMQILSQDGMLMATASQSMIVRTLSPNFSSPK